MSIGSELVLKLFNILIPFIPQFPISAFHILSLEIFNLRKRAQFNGFHSRMQKILSGGPDNVFLVINVFHRGS